MFRTLLLGFERSLKARVPFMHPILGWLVSHCAYVRTMQVKGEDGKTAHQRARGGPGPERLVNFGEVCRYKARAQEGIISRSGWRWNVGVWLGVDRHTGQYILYDKAPGGIKHARFQHA